MSKITSVLETARYKIGTTVWWVVLRPKRELSIEEAEQCHALQSAHPKELYLRGPLKKFWNKSAKLPKLHGHDFKLIIVLLTSNVKVEKYQIHDIIRSNETGEFLYCNGNGEWMPESFLMDSEVAARKEQNRIIRMVGDWHNQQA